jgi:hypothetical protein
MLLLGFVSGCTGSIHVILEVDFFVFASSVIKVSRTWPCYTFGPDALHFRSRLKAVKPYKTEGYLYLNTHVVGLVQHPSFEHQQSKHRSVRC